MTTKTTKKPIVVDNTVDEIDLSLFDTWDEAAEEAAIQEAAKVADVKYIILEGKTFAGRFPDGTVVKAPLAISVADLEAFTSENETPVDQLKALFVQIGDTETAEVLERMNLASVVIYAEKFFETFAKIAQVALGKS